MCGILGGISQDYFDKNICKLALDKIYHRGPDFQKINFYNQNRLFLAHSRLKIIDLSDSANQPMLSNCLNYEIIFNGEIFNFGELKVKCKEYDFKTNSDTEILLALFIKYGKGMLNMLNGMFAFAIFDKINNEIFIARDRFGIKQLYYTIDKNKFIFASEIPPILKFLKDVKEDKRTIKTYLTTALYDFGEHTFFEDIKRLEAGCYLEFNLNSFNYEINRWYFIEKNINLIENSLEKNSIFNKLEELLLDLIDKHLISDVNIGLNISGGLDSSILLSLVKKYKLNLHTFTQEYKGFSEKIWVEKAVQRVGFKQHFVDLNFDDIFDKLNEVVKVQAEPFGGIAVVGYYYLYKLAQEYNVTVLLDGNGIDEIFLGYEKYRLIQQNSILSEGVSIDGTKSAKLEVISSDLNNIEAYKIPKVNFFNDSVENVAMGDLLYTKVPRALRFNDRMSMMLSKELRVPFLDYRLVEFAYSLPINLLIDNDNTKAILRKFATKYIPKDVAYAKKRSIQTPQNEWIASKFEPLIEEILNSQSFKNRGWININKAKELFYDYKKSNKANSFFIWQWINLELWAREYLDKK